MSHGAPIGAQDLALSYKHGAPLSTEPLFNHFDSLPRLQVARIDDHFFTDTEFPPRSP